MVFIRGVRQCSDRRLGMWGPLDRPVGHATWLGGEVSSSFPTLDTPLTDLPWHVVKTVFENVQTHGRPAKVMWPAGHTLARLSLCFVPYHPLVSYCLWLFLILDIIKIRMDFGSYGVFPSSDVPEMVDQQNSWNSFVIDNYLLYLLWNVGMLAINLCILWQPTPPPPTHTHTLRVLLIPEQKKRIKSWGHKQEL
jgi:hypothetical protein